MTDGERVRTQTAHEPPDWWTPDDDEGATFPPGFVSLYVGESARTTFRVGQRPRTFKGRLRVEGGDLVVVPARRGKVEAEALRAALGLSVRAQAPGRPSGWRAVEIDAERVAAMSVFYFLASGVVVSRRRACELVSEQLYGDASHADSLQRSCLRWLAASPANTSSDVHATEN
jgi:hypothetical protein